MRKIIEFIVNQSIILLSVFLTFGMIYTMFLYTNSTQNAAIFYDEIVVNDYQIIIDINTGILNKNEIAKIELNNLNTNQKLLKTNSTWDSIWISSIVITIFGDIIALIYSIVGKIVFLFQKIKSKKILKDKFDLEDESLYKLPDYEPIVANAIYKRKHQYLMIGARLEYYYRINGILDKNNKINDKLNFDISSLTELEKILYKKFQKDEERTRKMTEREKDEEYLKNKKDFKDKINEILKENGYCNDDIVKEKIKIIIDRIKELKENKKLFIQTKDIIKNVSYILLLAILLIISEYTLLGIIIFLIWVSIKYTGISLTKEGEIERAKIILLINHLKKKKMLSEEEKYFLTMLTKY